MARRQEQARERAQVQFRRHNVFSKSRGRIMKKARELAILCGAEVATVITSPGGQVLSFGHPSPPDALIERFLREEPDPRLDRLIKAEKRKGEEIDKIRKETEGKVWWEKPLEELNVEQLEMLLAKMRDFRNNVDEEVRALQQAEEVIEGVPSNAPTGSGQGGEWSFQ